MSESYALVHGWDPTCYNNIVPEDAGAEYAWRNREILVRQLAESAELLYYAFPGFCNTPEPQDAESFGIEDFVNHFNAWVESQEQTPTLFIGYSFGGAVLLNYLANINPQARCVLISPAIVRHGGIASNFSSKLSQYLPNRFRDPTRRMYQNIFSKYYRKGSPFIRNSYNQIVRVDERDLLQNIDPSELFLIYGSRDMATPWEMVEETVLKNDIQYGIIYGGSHNIGSTHPNEIVIYINNFVTGF